MKNVPGGLCFKKRHMIRAESDVYIAPNGGRRCRECMRESDRRRSSGPRKRRARSSSAKPKHQRCSFDDDLSCVMCGRDFAPEDMPGAEGGISVCPTIESQLRMAERLEKGAA